MVHGKVDLRYIRYTLEEAAPVEAPVIEEAACALYVDEQPLVTLMCTPLQLECLAAGFLLSEGVIRNVAEIAEMCVYNEDRCAWYLPPLSMQPARTTPPVPARTGEVHVRLKGRYAPPAHKIVTSWSAGAKTALDLSQAFVRLNSPLRVTPQQVISLMDQLNESAELYRTCRGVHTSALSDSERLLAVAADVGRHNTLDKLRGECALRGTPTEGRIIVQSGRISSEMLAKAARMQVPLVISHSSPTSLSIRLAREWGITLVGYARPREFRVYTGEERILPAAVLRHGDPDMQDGAAWGASHQSESS